MYMDNDRIWPSRIIFQLELTIVQHWKHEQYSGRWIDLCVCENLYAKQRNKVQPLNSPFNLYRSCGYSRTFRLPSSGDIYAYYLIHICITIFAAIITLFLYVIWESDSPNSIRKCWCSPNCGYYYDCDIFASWKMSKMFGDACSFMPNANGLNGRELHMIHAVCRNVSACAEFSGQILKLRISSVDIR